RRCRESAGGRLLPDDKGGQLSSEIPHLRPDARRNVRRLLPLAGRPGVVRVADCRPAGAHWTPRTFYRPRGGSRSGDGHRDRARARWCVARVDARRHTGSLSIPPVSEGQDRARSTRADLERWFDALLIAHRPALARLAASYARSTGEREDL